MTSGVRVDELLRDVAPQVLGALAGRMGRFDVAEDAVQEAIAAAAEQWPERGIPDNPRAWLTTVATRRMIAPPADEVAPQAAIAAVHDEAPTAEAADRPQILSLYELLELIGPNPMVTLNHAVALAMGRGPEAGLAMVDTLDDDERLAGHHRLEAVRSHLLEMAGDHAQARVAFRVAARRTTSLAGCAHPGQRQYVWVRSRGGWDFGLRARRGDMAMTGGGGFPASFTINGGPWEGVYNDVRPNADGSYSYYGPAPAGTVKGTGSWGQTYPLPALHFTVGIDGSIHASLDMEGKNAHLHWNGGTTNWDLAALDTAKDSWRQAVETTHVNGVRTALQSAASQLSTGVTPAFVPTMPAASAASAAQRFDLASEDDFPSLTPTVTATPSPSTAPVPEQPTYAETQAEYVAPSSGFEDQQPGDQPWPPSGVVEEGYSLFSTQPEEQLAGSGSAAPEDDLSFLSAGPGAVLNPSSNAPVQAYLDESDETVCTFAVTDGRSLSIDRSLLEGAVAGTVVIPPSNDWITFDWMGATVDLPEAFFTET